MSHIFDTRRTYDFRYRLLGIDVITRRLGELLNGSGFQASWGGLKGFKTGTVGHLQPCLPRDRPIQRVLEWVWIEASPVAGTPWQQHNIGGILTLGADTSGVKRRGHFVHIHSDRYLMVLERVYGHAEAKKPTLA